MTTSMPVDFKIHVVRIAVSNMFKYETFFNRPINQWKVVREGKNIF